MSTLDYNQKHGTENLLSDFSCALTSQDIYIYFFYAFPDQFMPSLDVQVTAPYIIDAQRLRSVPNVSEIQSHLVCHHLLDVEGQMYTHKSMATLITQYTCPRRNYWMSW